MKRSSFFVVCIATFALALTACGGTEGDGDLAEAEQAVYGACTTQLINNEANAYNAYTACTRTYPRTQATACASQKNAWLDAWDAADAAGCWD
jgi:hypothetical protein